MNVHAQYAHLFLLIQQQQQKKRGKKTERIKYLL